MSDCRRGRRFLVRELSWCRGAWKYSRVGVRGVGSGRVHYALARTSLTTHGLGVDRLTCNARGTGSLFQSVVRRTSFSFKFRASSLPLVVRTVPSSSSSVALVVAGIRSPRRLSAHFSGFAPTKSSSALGDGILRGLRNTSRFFSLLGGIGRITSRTGSPRPGRAMPMFPIHLFSFSALSSMVRTSHLLTPFCANTGALCGSSRGGGAFVLTLTPTSNTSRRFGGMYGVLSRCDSPRGKSSSILTFLRRRYGVVISTSTVRGLSAVWAAGGGSNLRL